MYVMNFSASCSLETFLLFIPAIFLHLFNIKIRYIDGWMCAGVDLGRFWGLGLIVHVLCPFYCFILFLLLSWTSLPSIVSLRSLFSLLNTQRPLLTLVFLHFAQLVVPCPPRPILSPNIHFVTPKSPLVSLNPPRPPFFDFPAKNHTNSF